MAKYTLQEATLILPDVFKDRTMNLFTLTDNGASEFTFVVSRASAKNDEKVNEVAARIVRELQVTVPDFRLESSQEISVDGYPAVEMFYQFKNDNAVIFQKQTVILFNDQPSGQRVVCYIGTCPGEFSDYYHLQYQEVMKNIKFHTAAQIITSKMINADCIETFFALDCNSKVLGVFDGIQALYRHLPLQRAKEGHFLIFDRQGNQLMIAPVPGSQPPRYALWTTSLDDSHNLQSQLSVCRQISGPEALNTREKIQVFLMTRRVD